MKATSLTERNPVGSENHKQKHVLVRSQVVQTGTSWQYTVTAGLILLTTAPLNILHYLSSTVTGLRNKIKLSSLA